MVGQAKFIRALNYFNLVRLYGAVPLILENSPNPVTNLYTRTPVEKYILKSPATWKMQ
ncbi:MAG: RagB/SusD family nutrient uptake outer membrane protein [Bacteroidales bacterium]|nr:RagB/SusD family nutrient uptake outer membrane protein [Bacteroidales bacterium]